MRGPYQVPAVNFGPRGRMATAHTPGIPPANAATPDVRVVDGVAYVGGAPLAMFRAPSPGPTPSDSAQRAAPQFDVSKFGDSITIPIEFAAAGEVTALVRPAQTRIYLTIQNLTVVGNIFYCFDRVADNVSCIALSNGGSQEYNNAIPQGDLHIFSSGAGVVIVEYINAAILRA